MKKQTAVDWLEEQDNVLTMKLLEKKLTPREFVVQKSKLVEQAKQMEKEQIEDAHEIGYINGGNHKNVNGEQYYNETYGQTKN
jgi:hypothetical protein